MERKTLVFLLLVFLSVTISSVQSISFNLVPEVKKCIKEEVHKDVLVVGEYTLADVQGQTTNIMVLYLSTISLNSKWSTLF